MDKNKAQDYYCESVPSPILERRNKFISSRWEELSKFYLTNADETIKYLFYVNAGGTATIIGFMGASETVRSIIILRVALCFFAAGLLSVGILRVFLFHKVRRVSDNWQKDVLKYWKCEIGFNQLVGNDNSRTGSDLISIIIGYVSGGSFFIGLIFGGVSLFTY
jgi:hypothetical protein